MWSASASFQTAANTSLDDSAQLEENTNCQFPFRNLPWRALCWVMRRRIPPRLRSLWTHSHSTQNMSISLWRHSLFYLKIVIFYYHFQSEESFTLPVVWLLLIFQSVKYLELLESLEWCFPSLKCPTLWKWNGWFHCHFIWHVMISWSSYFLFMHSSFSNDLQRHIGEIHIKWWWM